MIHTLRFGDRMRLLREEKGWSVRETARRLDVDKRYVHRLEAGDFLPEEERLRLLVKTFGVSIQRMTDWMVADRLTVKTGEKAPGVNWFMRSLADLDERGQRQAIKALLSKLAQRQQKGDPWPDEFDVRRRAS
jgi:transcriptional regulator with XRE-family HTH domain